MKIDAYDVRTLDLPLVMGYRITGKTINECQNHVVRITANGLSGIGSASPSGTVTGEDDAMCIAALHGTLAELTRGYELGDGVDDWSQKAFLRAPDCPSARAAVDMALWDLLGKAAGKPLVELWGSVASPVATSVTIGICSVEQTLLEARDWLARGFFVIKVKIGEDLEIDVERLRKLRELAGPDIVIRVDANQGYDLEGARSLLKQTARLNIEMFEQPIHCDALDDLKTLTGESKVPIVADESAGSVEECFNVVDRRAAHGINIKMMKCGGPTAAWKIHDYAHNAGLQLMLGCNDETRISIAAGVHLAQSMPGLKYADLDGHMDLASDPARGGFHIVDGRMVLSSAPGLGIEFDW